MLRLFIVLFTREKIMLVFYSAFNLCYRPLCKALTGDLINIVIWIMNGDDKGKLEGGCRGDAALGTWWCLEAGESYPPGTSPLQGPTAPAGDWDTGLALCFPTSASFIV